MGLKSYFEEKYASRKFIDLIRKSSSKWANWDPPVAIKVGSYGKIDSKSGAFQVQGNIYDFKSSDGKPMFKDQPEKTPMVKEYKVKSTDETCREINAGPSLAFAGIPLTKATGRWQFGSNRGAFLMMVDSQITILPQKVKNDILASSDKMLRDLKVVTLVHTCHSYSLYLSNKTKELVHVELAAQAPTPPAPGVMVGGEVGLEWRSQGTEGLFQNAVGEKGHFDFTPLFEVEKIRGPERRRDEGPPEEGGDRWDVIPIPWGPLDSDGEEELDIPDLSDDEEDF